MRKTKNIPAQGELMKAFENRTHSDVYMIIGLVSITMLFIPFAIILLSSNSGGIQVPSWCNLGMVSVALSSMLIARAKKYRREDQLRSFNRVLALVLLLGAGFLFMQYMGWKQIIGEMKNTHRDIITVIVIVHAIHFCSALVVMAVQYRQVLKIKSDADFYLYFLNPRKVFLSRFAFIYWDFLSALWLILYTLLQIN